MTQHHLHYQQPNQPGDRAALEFMPRWKVATLAGMAIIALQLAFARNRRRALLAWMATGLVSGGALLLVALRAARRPRAEAHTIPIHGLHPALDGLKVAQIGDLHLHQPYTITNLQQARRWLDQVQPDLIALTGDFINDPEKVTVLERELAGLNAPLGMYAVLGNHDYWSSPDGVEGVLTRLGIKLLVNEHHVIEHRGGQLVVAGVDDAWYGYSDLQAALAGSSPELPVLLLSHCPDFIIWAANFKIALQLSGHAHAGHISLPLLGPAFLPLHGRRYYRGLHRVKQSWLYVNRGLGGRPIRLFARPEYTLLRLRSI